MHRWRYYENVSEVVGSAPLLLQEAEYRRRDLNVMLRESEEEADRDGTFSVESVLAEIDETIVAAKYCEIPGWPPAARRDLIEAIRGTQGTIPQLPRLCVQGC